MSDLDEFAETIAFPAHREIFAYWRSKAPPGLLPGRQHLDPVDIPELLPSIALYDVVRDGGVMRFRFRLVGTGNVERYGRDATGKWFEDMYTGDILEVMLATYRGVAENGAPHLSNNRMPVAGKEHVDYDRLILPLADDGKTVDVMMSLMVFDD